MNKIAFLLFPLLLVACSTKNELIQANSRIQELELQISQQQSEYREKESSLNNQISDITKELEDLEIKLDLQATEMDAVIKDRDELSDKFRNSQAEITRLRSEARSLSNRVNRLICDEQVNDMKYENILDASTIIAAWWARQPGVKKLQGTYRDKIWSNALTGIHGVEFISSKDNEEYVEHFLIYFDEFSMKPGVFWVGGQCWLDEP